MANDTFLQRRAEFASALDLNPDFTYADHKHLYTGYRNLARDLYVAEKISQCSSVDGDMAELGIWRGANSMLMAKLTRLLGIEKHLYCFDSFEGLPTPSTYDRDSYEPGTYQSAKDEFVRALALFGLVENVSIVEGMIEEPLPKFTMDVRTADVTFSLVYFDADLFSPAQAMFKYLAPRINVGGIILLDEYGFPDWPGETHATDAFVKQNQSYVLSLTPDWVFQPSAVITRVS